MGNSVGARPSGSKSCALTYPLNTWRVIRLAVTNPTGNNTGKTVAPSLAYQYDKNKEFNGTKSGKYGHSGEHGTVASPKQQGIGRLSD